MAKVEFKKVVVQNPVEEMVVSYGIKDPAEYDWEAYNMSWLQYCIHKDVKALANALNNVPNLPEALMFKLIPLAQESLEMMNKRIEQADSLFMARNDAERFNAVLDLINLLDDDKFEEIQSWAKRALDISKEKALAEAEEKLAGNL